jgi:hypothetical protein
VPADDLVVKTVRTGNFFHVTEAPDRDENFITCLLKLPDNRGEEVSVGRVIEVDPNAHF